MNKILILFLLSFASCSKYDEGPELSLRTKTARLTGEWELVRFNGSAEDGLEFDFRRNNELLITEITGSRRQTEEGTWAWAENKEEIALTWDGIRAKVKVLRLTNRELSLENVDLDKLDFEKK